VSAVHPRVPCDDDTFTCEGNEIFLRCINEDGVHIGDLRVAQTNGPLHADTLVNAANAGMRYMRNQIVDAALTDILNAHTSGDGGAGDDRTGDDGTGDDGGEEIARGGDQP